MELNQQFLRCEQVALSLDDHTTTFCLVLKGNAILYPYPLIALWLMVAIEIKQYITHTSNTFFLRARVQYINSKSQKFLIQLSSRFSKNPVDRHSLADRRVYLAVILALRTRIKKSLNMLVK